MSTADQVSEAPSRERTKASFNLPQVDLDALRQIAEERDTTVTEALRGAIATERYIRDAVKRDARIIIEEPDGRVRELVFHRELARR